MHLKLKELQQVAKKTIKEEQKYATIREEFFRVFGPPVMVSKNCDRVAEAVNEQLDLSEASRREVQRGNVKTSVLIEASISNSVALRKVAARLLPEKMAARLLEDPSSSVRCAAAKRLPYALVRESIKNFPNDDQFLTIVRQKKLQEAGLPAPEEIDEPFDMYGEEPLGDSSKTRKSEKDLPDTWYKRLAHKICSEYGGNLEGNWEEIIATRIVASHYSTTGVKLDRDKLLNSIYDCIKEREDAVLGEGSLKAIASRLLKESYLDDAVMPIVEEDVKDPVADLLESNYSTAQYVDETERLFSVKKSSIPSGIKKYRIGEGSRAETLVPVNGKIPGGLMTSIVEQALDRYVDSWNKRQALAGEPYRLSWGPHATGIDMVGFNLQLK
jgi:hypothetical protein